MPGGGGVGWTGHWNSGVHSRQPRGADLEVPPALGVLAQHWELFVPRHMDQAGPMLDFGLAQMLPRLIERARALQLTSLNKASPGGGADKGDGQLVPDLAELPDLRSRKGSAPAFICMNG